MATKERLDSFYHFASQQVENGGAELSLDELYLVWRVRHPMAAELVESVAAVKAAFADHEAGDAGQPARLALRDACRELGLVIDE
jgi:hypothetical protein